MRDEIVNHSNLLLRPDPARTVLRPFEPSDPPAFADAHHPRSDRIAERILGLSDVDLSAELDHVIASLRHRHHGVDEVLMRRFREVEGLSIDKDAIDHGAALLIGAYFSEEFSFEAAALFNPSMVLHPDQSDLPEGGVRFALSLRGIGEGHVSSVTFRSGRWSPQEGFEIDPPHRTAVTPVIEMPRDLDDPDLIRLRCGGGYDLSEKVLFPIVPRQRQGIEDVRLVRFVEGDGAVTYYGTYTAFSGAAVQQEILTTDFHDFEMRPVKGPIAGAKGLALFPRRIEGRYAAIARHDSENLWLLTSDDLYDWRDGNRILIPKKPWEYIQIGNCGSPIEIDEGWLLLTHGVGPVRNYCVGACLLDKDDPSRVLARTHRPLLRPRDDQRDGYVPNVIYSCGGIVHDRTLLLPYGVADNFAAFASVNVNDLLAVME